MDTRISKHPGRLKDPTGSGSLQFKIQVALDEIGRLAKVAARPRGTVTLNGTAKLDPNNNYEVVGNLQSKDVSIQHGAERIGNVNVFSAVHLKRIVWTLKGSAWQRSVPKWAANVASLEDLAHYKLNGNLRHLDLRTVAPGMGQKDLAYDGTVSGSLAAEGDLKTPGTKSVVARARLSIAPGRRGILVSGRLYAEYDGETENISLGDSFIALPHTRINLSGSLGDGLNIALTTRNLNDLLAAAPPSGPPPVTLNGGQANLTAVVIGRLTSPNITGRLAVNQSSWRGGSSTHWPSTLPVPGSAVIGIGRVSPAFGRDFPFLARYGWRVRRPSPQQVIGGEMRVAEPGGYTSNRVALHAHEPFPEFSRY